MGVPSDPARLAFPHARRASPLASLPAVGSGFPGEAIGAVGVHACRELGGEIDQRAIAVLAAPAASLSKNVWMPSPCATGCGVRYYEGGLTTGEPVETGNGPYVVVVDGDLVTPGHVALETDDWEAVWPIQSLRKSALRHSPGDSS